MIDWNFIYKKLDGGLYHYPNMVWCNGRLYYMYVYETYGWNNINIHGKGYEYYCISLMEEKYTGKIISNKPFCDHLYTGRVDNIKDIVEVRNEKIEEILYEIM